MSPWVHRTDAGGYRMFLGLSGAAPVSLLHRELRPCPPAISSPFLQGAGGCWGMVGGVYTNTPPGGWVHGARPPFTSSGLHPLANKGGAAVSHTQFPPHLSDASGSTQTAPSFPPVGPTCGPWCSKGLRRSARGRGNAKDTGPGRGLGCMGNRPRCQTGGQSQRWPTSGPGGYITSAAWGVLDALERWTKSEVADKWAGWLHTPAA